MRHTLALAAALLILSLTITALVIVLDPKKADTVIIHGRIYTLDPARPVVEAVAISGDRILAVGTSEQILSEYRADSVIDLKGKVAFPGFIDSHAHVEGLGTLLTNVNLIGTSSLAEVQERVAYALLHTRPGAWIRGRGWDQNRWPEQAFPDCRILDAVAPDVPVVLKRVDGHAVWVNSMVMARANITKTTPDPPGGRIIRDSKGNPTGVFIDAAADRLLALLPPLTHEERREALLTSLHECAKAGLTCVHDMGVDTETVAIYRELLRSRELPVRVYAAIDGPGVAWDKLSPQGPDTSDASGLFTLRALKLYADGALGSRGAALTAPYVDDPKNLGLLVTAPEKMKELVREAAGRGFQVCTHAIGDRANTIVLNVYEDAVTSVGEKAKALRLRVEHAQVLQPSDIPRFAQLGVIPAMQPTHCTSDMPWVEARIGAERAAYAYAWRSLISSGSIVPAGSDFPVESPNPLLGFYAAIARQDISGKPEGGWHPEQRMSREEALKAFTTWGAYAGFNEARQGMLKPGMWADIVVLTDDIMQEEVQRIPGTRVFLTMVGGKVIYRAEVLRVEG